MPWTEISKARGFRMICLHKSLTPKHSDLSSLTSKRYFRISQTNRTFKQQASYAPIYKMQFHTLLALSTLALTVLGAALPVADPVAGNRM